MAYTKVGPWVNGADPPISAANLDQIEDGIDDAHVAIDGHLVDAADAHDASAISIADAGAHFTGTDVEAALQELGAGGGGGGGGALTVIAETVLASAAASIAFSSIPQTYRHLEVVVAGRFSAAAIGVAVIARFNGDSGNNYDWQLLRGTSSSTVAANGTGASAARFGPLPAASATANFGDGMRAIIPNYRGTTFHKTSVAQGSGKWSNTASDMNIDHYASWWRSTAAITAITLAAADGSNFLAGSVATLYGMSGA